MPQYLQMQIQLYRRIYGNDPLDSDVLRVALGDYAGVPDSNDWSSDRRVGYAITNQAHHIVEAHDEAAEPARAILAHAGIHLNSAANGVLLPTTATENTGNATLHWGSHSREYAACVNGALTAAVQSTAPYIEQYRDNVLTRLAEIRRVLLTCNVPINGNVDANVVLQGGVVREVGINDIFRKYNLYNNL